MVDLVTIGGSRPSGRSAVHPTAIADLPERARGHTGGRIRGIASSLPGTSHGDGYRNGQPIGDTCDSETFDWTVTGDAILPLTSGVNVRMDWGRTSSSQATIADVTTRITLRDNLPARPDHQLGHPWAHRRPGSMSFEFGQLGRPLRPGEHVARPLHGLIRARHPRSNSETGHNLWTGVLDSIPTTYDDGSGQHRAQCDRWGIYSTLTGCHGVMSGGSLELNPARFRPSATSWPRSTTPAVSPRTHPGDAYVQMQRWWERSAAS